MNNSKTILYLLNGLGVASKDSFDIKFNEIMPNLSMLMRNYIYTNIENKNYNYKNAFRNFSLGDNLLPTYDKVKNDTNFSNNPTIINIANDVISNNSKLHLFCFLDNEQVINHVIKIVTELKQKGNLAIYIHVVLRQKDVQEYDNIIKLIKSLEDKITILNSVEIGTVVGERQINDEKYYELMTKYKGEKWPDHNRKLNYAKQIGITPRKLDGFYLKDGFKIETNDISLFLNYEDVDCNQFISRITNVKLYTLFPMKAYNYAISIYEDVPPNEYFSKSLEKNNIKCLVLTTNDRIPTITYNLCGLKDQKSQNITFLDINDKNNNSIDNLVKSDYQYIIYDYDIANYKEIGAIKEFLMARDTEIEEIYKRSDQYGINLVISSLYGLFKEYTIGLNKQVVLDYSSEVPVVLIAQNYPASKYALKYGNTHDLSNTIFTIINNGDIVNTLFRKKGILGFFQ